jgi:hypothetical protein
MNEINLYSNLLQVAGTGQNTGKTTLACYVIQRFALDYKVISIKLSPHFHTNESGQLISAATDKFAIWLETSKSSGKDSSRMLAAGAYKSFYIQVKDEGLQLIAPFMQQLLGEGNPVVCESGSLHLIFKPQLFFVCTRKDESRNAEKSDKIIALADKVIDIGSDLEESLQTLDFSQENGFYLSI